MKLKLVERLEYNLNVSIVNFTYLSG